MTIKEFRQAGNSIRIGWPLTTWCTAYYDNDNDYDDNDFKHVGEIADQADFECKDHQEEEDFDPKKQVVSLYDKNGKPIVENVTNDVADVVISLM